MSCQYRKSYCGDKAVLLPSYFHKGIPLLIRWHLYIESGPWLRNCIYWYDLFILVLYFSFKIGINNCSLWKTTANLSWKIGQWRKNTHASIHEFWFNVIDMLIIRYIAVVVCMWKVISPRNRQFQRLGQDYFRADSPVKEIASLMSFSSTLHT